MNERHVMPEYDLIEHEASASCICLPEVEHVVTFMAGGPPGPVPTTPGLIYIHYSLYAHIHTAE